MTRTAADVLIVTYENLGNRRKLKRQMHDVRLLAGGRFPGVGHPESVVPHVLVFVEAVGRVELDGWETVQARRRDGSWAGEAILIRDDVPIISRRVVLAALDRLGQRIRDRTFPAVRIRTPFRIAGRRRLKLVGVHMPIRRVSGELRRTYKLRLRSVTALRRRWLTIGDRNERHPGASVGGVLVAGNRIDLAYASRTVAEHVIDTRLIKTGRKDDHPVVRVVLG